MGKLMAIKDLPEDQRETCAVVSRLNHLTLNSIFSNILLLTIEEIDEFMEQPESKGTILERAFCKTVLKDYSRGSVETIKYMIERMHGKSKEVTVIEQPQNETPLSTEQLQKLALKALAYQERELEYNKKLKDNPDLTPEKFLENKKQSENNNITIEGTN